VEDNLTIVFEEPRSPSTVSPDDVRKSGIAVEMRSSKERLAPAPACESEYLLWVESGAGLDTETLEKLWSKRREAEIVLASRYLRGGMASLPVGLSFLNRRVSRLVRSALRLPCTDPLSGIRLFERKALEEVPANARERPDSLDVLVHLENLGFRIREVPHRSTASSGFRRVLGDLLRSLFAIPRLRRMRNSEDAADADDRGFQSLLPWRRRRLERRQQTIVGYLEVDVAVLDVGCGSGRLVQTVSKAIGLDRDMRKLRFLRGRARAAVAGELTRLPFRDGSFPQIVCTDVVRSFDPGAAYLPELGRVLRPHGTLVLATSPGSTRARRGSEGELRRELERNGFAVDEVRKSGGGEILVRAVRSGTGGPA
jgi:Methyltransferase domain